MMHEQPMQRLRLTLGLLLTVYVLNFLDRQIMAVLAEPVSRDLDLTDAQIGVMTGLAFAIFYTAVGLPIARYADRPMTNRVYVIAASLALWSAMTALCSLPRTFAQMLLARVGVGIGEAGGTPPSHSLIADLVPADRRSSAMAVYQLGPALGVLLGMVAGGLLADHVGWRATFLILGLPGIAFAAIVAFALKDPRISMVASVADPRPSIGLAESLHLILAPRAMRWLIGVAAFGTISGQGIMVWATIFFQRTHGLTPGETGTTFGVMAGLAMIAGVWSGGKIGDRMLHRGNRHVMTVPAVGFLVSVPFTIVALLVDQWWLAVILFFPAIGFQLLHIAPYYATIQGLVPLQTRAFAAATVLLLQNLVGLGLGPVLLGWVSDLVKPQFGPDSVRIVLVIATLFSLLAAFLLWKSRQYLDAELERAPAMKVA